MRLDVFAELHTITQFEADSKPYLPMILAGQNNLADNLLYRTAVPLASRIVARSHLPAVDLPGMRDYITHHLKIAGLHNSPFDEQAVTAIHQGSGGLFRKANHLSRGALIAAAGEKSQTVTAEHVRLADSELYTGTVLHIPYIEDTQEELNRSALLRTSVLQGVSIIAIYSHGSGSAAGVQLLITLFYEFQPCPVFNTVRIANAYLLSCMVLGHENPKLKTVKNTYINPPLHCSIYQLGAMLKSSRSLLISCTSYKISMATLCRIMKEEKQ